MNKHGIYIGTYKKYNNGSIAGKWFYFEDYHNADDFWADVKETHKAVSLWQEHQFKKAIRRQK